MIVVPRTCTELPDDGGAVVDWPAPPQPLSAFRARAAYVLLGDPGMGKTTAFEEEALALGEDACLVTARDFAHLDVADRPEWRGRILFIDGLDEIRAGQSDPRTPFDAVRRNLDRLGKPRFRLSCRHADWLVTDQKRLAAVSSSGNVAVLCLNPLDESGSAKLLENDSNVQDVDAFIEEAHKRGIQGLLANPQSLSLLVKATHDGVWPDSRERTFEKACLVMAQEYNEEHVSIRSRQDPHETLDTAGRLCAVLLLSGTSGYAATVPKANGDYPYMTDCGLGNEACLQSTASKLFRFREAGRVEPVHRHIAEYLAARHIASLIEGGLPYLRIVALLSGVDGTVVSELRGLSAWLATRSRLARYDLMERDPTGVALYADIQTFSAQERYALFGSLVREPRKLVPTYRTARAFVPLVTPGMRDVLKRALADPPGGADGPLVVEFILRLLGASSPLPDLAPNLLEIVRNNMRWPRVRYAALDAFIRYGRDGVHDSELLDLLRDIQARHVGDPDDQLLGMLLSALYPRHIPPSEVWDYMKESSGPYGGTFERFWVSVLPSLSTDAGVADLLDVCNVRLAEFERTSSFALEWGVARLLVRGLERLGDELGIDRLYDWLDVGVRLGIGNYLTRREADSIRRWIEERPHLHADLLLEGIGRFPDEHWYAPYEAFQRLFRAAVSGALYEACVIAADSMFGERPKVAEPLLRFAVLSGRLEPQQVRDLLAHDSRLPHLLDRLLEPALSSPALVEREEAIRAHREEAQRKARRELEVLKENEHALRNNQASPTLLYGLARRYFGNSIEFTPEQGVTRIKELAGSDAELLDAIQTGLRRVVDRDGVPDVDTVVEQRLRSKIHLLCLPYLMGLAEADRSNSPPHTWWTEDQARKALAAYFGYAHGDYQPLWYERLIAEHPDTVAEVQVQFAAALLRAGIDTGNASLWHLAFDPAHARVARHASLPLLRAFPAGANGKQLHSLDHLLLAAFQHADRAEFSRLVDKKVSRKSLPPRQRGRWLAAGCAIAPDEFESAATAFIHTGRGQARTIYLASFFCPQERTVSPIAVSDTHLPALLVRLIGRFIHPDVAWGEGVVTPAMDASTLVSQCIQKLAGNPAPDATDALTNLLRDPELSRWHFQLTWAADDQRVCRRDHEYRHPTLEQVVKTLSNGGPAGPGDLAALVLDRLDAIADQIESGSTDNWKAYWNEDPFSNAIKPKPERSCVRTLLRELNHVLPTGVSADREVLYPNETRADIRVSHSDYHIPVEVKCSYNKELWSAAKAQLISKYASDPATQGYGIYLVFWFGSDRTQRSPAGGRPTVPDDLQRQLETTVNDQERRTIFFRVIDASMGGMRQRQNRSRSTGARTAPPTRNVP